MRERLPPKLQSVDLTTAAVNQKKIAPRPVPPSHHADLMRCSSLINSDRIDVPAKEYSFKIATWHAGFPASCSGKPGAFRAHVARHPRESSVPFSILRSIPQHCDISFGSEIRPVHTIAPAAVAITPQQNSGVGVLRCRFIGAVTSIASFFPWDGLVGVRSLGFFSPPLQPPSASAHKSHRAQLP